MAAGQGRDGAGDRGGDHQPCAGRVECDRALNRRIVN